jgi:hypothetical protein
MTGGRLNAEIERYLQAVAMNMPPPPVASDPLITGTAPIEQVLRVLGLAANSGDPRDNAEAISEHARRDAGAAEAAEMFAAQDAEAAIMLDGVATPDQSAAMAQQLPQTAAGIAAALAGALGGALQPLAQLPQQVAQGAQQVLQAGSGLFAASAGATAAPIDGLSLDASPALDEFDSLIDDFAAPDGGGSGFDSVPAGAGGTSGGGGGGGVGPGVAVSAPALGPPPIPSASTAPASAPASPATAPRPPAASGAIGPGIAGMPMIPPGAVGAAGATDKEAKTDTKRVSVPPVRNGAPVQGRLIPVPSPPQVTRNSAGKPVATRRITGPDGKTGADRPGRDDGSAD